MAGRGRARRKGKGRNRSRMAGLIFPVGRINRIMKKTNHSDRISGMAPIYLAAILEYLVVEIIELVGNTTKQLNKTRINPRHLHFTIQNDEELKKLFEGVTLPEAGVIPKIEEALLYKRKVKKAKALPAWEDEEMDENGADADGKGQDPQGHLENEADGDKENEANQSMNGEDEKNVSKEKEPGDSFLDDDNFWRS